MSNRELILVRIAELMAGTEGVEFFVRNSLDIPEAKLPAIVLLDGDEEANEAAFGRGRPANGPNLVTMSPEIFVVVKARPESMGADLNEWLDFIVSAVQNDDELLTLVHNNDIRYLGCTTGLAQGRSMQGELRVNLALTYVR